MIFKTYKTIIGTKHNNSTFFNLKSICICKYIRFFIVKSYFMPITILLIKNHQLKKFH
jgi:hypothetical protein